MRELFYAMLSTLTLIMGIVLSVPYWGYAQQSQIKPGEYITEGGWGELSIKKNNDGNLAFEISTVGSNAHTCDLQGTIHNGQAILQALKDNPCIVTFHRKGQDIEVTDNDDVCRYYCGARAGFTGLYLKPKQGCSEAAISKSRDEFKRLYDKKAYAQASAILEPILKSCENVMYWSVIGHIRNDLAITQYKLGKYAECLHTLQPLEEDAKQTNDELKDFYPPADADERIPIAKATRTNLKLCQQKIFKKP